jgi:hypothetical protein
MAVVLILILIMIGVGIIMNLGFKFFSWLFKSHFAPHSENQVLAIKQDAAEQEGILSRFTGGCKSLVTNIFSGSEEDKKIDEALKELQEAAAEYNNVEKSIRIHTAQYNIVLAKIRAEAEAIERKLELRDNALETVVKGLPDKLSTEDLVESVVLERAQILSKRARYRQEISIQSCEHDRLEKLLELPDNFFLTIPMKYKCIKEKTAYLRDKTRDLLEHHRVGVELDQLYADASLTVVRETERFSTVREDSSFVTRRM